MKSTTSFLPVKIGAPRRLTASFFAAALFAGLSAASAVVPGYYPDPNSPVAGNNDLTFIETKLPTGKTLVLPPPTGKTAATDKDLEAATALAITDELDGTDVANVTVQSLVREAIQRMPSKAPAMIDGITAAIIANSTGTARENFVEQALTEAAAANPKTAHVVAGNAIKVIVLDAAAQDTADEAAAGAIAGNKALAAKIVSGAIAGSKKATSVSGGTEQATAITQSSVRASIDAGAPYLVEEVTTAALIAAAKLGSTPGAPTVAAMTEAALDGVQGTAIDNLETAVQIAAAASRGASANGTGAISAGNVTAIKGQITSHYGAGATATSANTAVDAFAAVRGSGSDSAAPGAASSFVSGHANEAAAATAGAVAGWNKVADQIVAEALAAAVAASSDDSNVDIIAAGVRAYPTGTAKIAKAVTDKAETIGSIGTANAGAVVVAGVIKGTTRELVGTAVLSVLKAVDTAATAGATVTAAVNAAEAAGFNNTIGAITYNATKAKKAESVNIVTAAVGAADVNTDLSKAAAAVAGAIVADKNNALAIKNAALAVHTGDAAEDAVINKAHATATGILLTPLDFYNVTNTQLASSTTNSEALAVVYAATIANPKGASAIAAAAIAGSSAPTASILAAAQASDFKKATNVEFAVNAAVASKGASSGTIGAYVEDQVFTNSFYAVDIAIGAVAAAPQYAHIIGHRAAFRAPTAAAKVTTALFSFSKIDTSEVVDKPAAAGAIMAGITNGIIEAKLVPTKELAALKASITAAVKATLLPKNSPGLEGPMMATSDGTVGGSSSKTSKGAAGVVTGYISQHYNPGINANRPADLSTDVNDQIEAILTAAGKAAKQYVLEMAQAAAQAARAMAGSSFTGAKIVAAFSAAGSAFSQTQIQNAVNFGIAQAALGIPGAGAASTVALSHRSGTGDPVTSIFDL